MRNLSALFLVVLSACATKSYVTRSAQDKPKSEVSILKGQGAGWESAVVIFMVDAEMTGENLEPSNVVTVLPGHHKVVAGYQDKQMVSGNPFIEIDVVAGHLYEIKCKRKKIGTTFTSGPAEFECWSEDKGLIPSAS